MLDNLFITIKEFQPIATEIIAIVAVFGFFNTRLLWKQSNRPIVSALVETNSSGNIATMFDLTVINSGNRPAIDIQLTIDNYTEFEKCFENKDKNIIRKISQCFNKDSVIPLLINGEKKSNSFGLTSRKE